MIIEHRVKRWSALLVLFVLFAAVGCASPPEDPHHEDPAEHWSITAWGERFEVFPEIDALVAGQSSSAHVHVTRLSDFAPLAGATVEIVLVDASGEQRFDSQQPDRPGVFTIELTPGRSGEADLLFRVRDEQGSEEIRGGRVRVGAADQVGSLLRAPAPRAGSDRAEPLDFTKEQQWKGEFGTTWVRDGSLARTVGGLAILRPPAGGESTVTAPIGGVVQAIGGSRSWPYVGFQVNRGAGLFRVVPLVAPETSLASLGAELETLTIELETARDRTSRLEQLLALEAVSERAVESARTQSRTLDARRRAAARDLETARSSRGGTGSGREGAVLRAPFSGEIASMAVTPGATIAAGDALARLVRTDVAWIEVALAPEDGRRVAEHGVRGLVLEDPERGSMRIEDGISLVSIAPELSSRTGTVGAFFEMPASADFALGSTVSAQVLLEQEQAGIVVPSSSIIDDGGVSVVYLQLSGEAFVRQEVVVLERQGDLVLVDRLTPGQRLVTRGGDGIRRSSLMATGDSHGHMH